MVLLSHGAFEKVNWQRHSHLCLVANMGLHELQGPGDTLHAMYLYQVGGWLGGWLTGWTGQVAAALCCAAGCRSRIWWHGTVVVRCGHAGVHTDITTVPCVCTHIPSTTGINHLTPQQVPPTHYVLLHPLFTTCFLSFIPAASTNISTNTPHDPHPALPCPARPSAATWCSALPSWTL